MPGPTPDPLGHQEGILRPRHAWERIDIGRAAPGERLASYVDYHWWVTWHVPASSPPHRQEVIPRPVSHLSAEVRDGVPRMLVHGVWTRRFDRVLEGDGRAVACAFRPGGLRPFLRSSARGLAALRDREVPAEELFGVDDRPLARRLVHSDASPEDLAGELEEWLLALDPPVDPMVDEVAALVARAESDATITRAEQLAELAGVTLRTLQRQLSSYVGVGPKWVVQRCRLLDVAAAAHEAGSDAGGGDGVDWAGLAAELGYADQSHLIRAFTRIVGDPPAAYTRAHV